MRENEERLRGGPYVREARPEEFEEIVEVSAAAFEFDPPTLYFGSVTKEEVRSSPLFLTAPFLRGVVTQI